MKNIYFRTLLTTLLLLYCTVASAHDFEVDGVFYSITSSADKTVAVTYRGSSYSAVADEYSGIVIIPSTVTYNAVTYDVTSIGGLAFYNCTGLTSVTILNSVTTIGQQAFYNCTGLTSITIPNSVTSIGTRAFEGCTGLTSITIPNSVTTIGSNAFYECTGLTAVNITDLSAWCKIDFNTNDSNPLYYAKNLYLNGEKVTNLVIPSDITEIKKYAFYNCSGLTSITIPNSVTSIGAWAFEGCSGLTSVTIGNSVTTIGNYAFRGCTGLTAVNITDLSAWYKIDFNSDYSNPLYYAKNLYLNGEKVTNLVIPSDITEIKKYAFYNCTGLTSITIPNSVTTIGESAFRNCTGLTSITIPNSVTEIGSGTFSNCNVLKIVFNNSSLDITVGSSSHGYVAYYATAVITEENSADYDIVGDYFFYNKDSICTLIAYIGNDSVITLPQSYKGKNYTIGERAFQYCTGLTSVTIPNNVTSIGDCAFSDCTGLTSITIPNSVTSIGGWAFSWCTGLTSVTIPNSVTTIEKWEFCGCTGLTSVTIPNNVTSIGESAFYGCTDLTEITIPNSVTTIENCAFNGCTGLTSITIPNSVTCIEFNAFCGCTGLTSVTIPNSVTTIGSSAFYGCTDLTEITIPNSVTTIEYGAFMGCTGLTSITLPNSITEIGSSAFYGCSNLTEIHVKAETPPTIYSYTFSVYTTATLYVPAGTKEAYQAADYWKNFINIKEKRRFTFSVDINLDGETDIADVTEIVDILLEGDDTTSAQQTFDAWTSNNANNHGTTSQHSYTLEATENSILTFDWDVSSESNSDFLEITLNDTEIIKKSGEQSGSYKHTFTAAGTYTLVVKYIKDSNFNAGNDLANVYNIKLSDGTSRVARADLDSDGTVDVADVTLLIEAILYTE